MPRKSKEALSVAPRPSVPRVVPNPPLDLTDRQNAVWQAVMKSAAGAYISPEALPVLVEYCRAVVASEDVSREVENFEPTWNRKSEEGLRRWKTLHSMQDLASKRVANLAVKLRIAPSSRMHQRTAGVAENRHVDGPRPWD